MIYPPRQRVVIPVGCAFVCGFSSIHCGLDIMTFQKAHRLVVNGLVVIGLLQILSSLVTNWHFTAQQFGADQVLTWASVLISTFAGGAQLIALAFVLEYLKQLLDKKNQ